MALANQFAQPLDLLNAQVEKQLVDMVLALTKEVVHVEVQTNPQVILDTVKASVEALPIAGTRLLSNSIQKMWRLFAKPTVSKKSKPVTGLYSASQP